MKEIRDKIKLFGRKGMEEIEALFDTGSSYGYISKEIANRLGLFVLPEEHEIELSDKTKIKMKPAFGIVEVKGCRRPIWTYINPKPLSPMVLGMIQMETLGVKIDAKKGYTVSCELPRI